MLTLKQVIEALVFASPQPISAEEIRKALRGAAADSEDLDVIGMGEATEEDVAAQLVLLRAEYEELGRAFQLTEQANGWAIMTVADAGDWVRQLYPESRPARLSGPALETLAIIAYRQPVTRADIEAVRGVAVDGVMQVLLDRNLVKIAGRAELPGRPLLYNTTGYFLEHFGLKNAEELPNSDELRRVDLPKAEIAEPKKAAKSADGEEPTADEPTPENPNEPELPLHDEAAEQPAEITDPDAPESMDSPTEPPVAIDPASDAAVAEPAAEEESKSQ